MPAIYGTSPGIGILDGRYLKLNASNSPLTGALLIDGSADAVQFTVQGNATQTNFLTVFENSAGADQFTFGNTGAFVANEQGNAVDFRVETDTDANALFIQGGSNNVGIGTATPSAKLQVIGSGRISDAATPTKQYQFRTSGSGLDIDFGGAAVIMSSFVNADFSGTQQYYIRLETSSHLATAHGTWYWRQGNGGSDTGNEVLKIDAAASSGELLVFNGDGNNYDLRMRGQGEFNLFFMDASADRIGIGTSGPTERLGVNGNIALETAGNGLQIKEGTNATMGVVTLVAGTAVVSTTQALTASRIFLTAQSLGTVTIGQGLAVSARVNATSFTILSQSAIDTSVVAWMIVNPA